MSTGKIIVNDGTITAFSTGMDAYGIMNKSSGVIEINGGIINAYTTGTWNTYGISFNNINSYFYFNGGKILGKNNSIYPTTKSIELQPNTYVKKYSESVNGVNYSVAEIKPTSNIKVINNDNVTYYEDLKTVIIVLSVATTVSKYPTTKSL